MLKQVVIDLIKRWGVVKLLEAMVDQLYRMGGKEKDLAGDLEDAISRYKQK